jgi:hypothetical protein
VLGRSLVRRPIPGPVDHAQDFLGVGQAQHQRVVAPGAVVGDVHALLAFPGGLDQRAVHVEDRLLEERGRLPGPDPDTNVVNHVEQRHDVGGREPPAEVARGGRVGNAAGAQGVEEDLVVAAEFDVLQAGALAQGVVGEVEHMIRLVKRQVDLEQAEAVVDGVDQADLPGQGVDDANAAVDESAAAVGDLVMNVAGGDRGPGAIAELGGVEAALDAPLAVGQSAGYGSCHSKSSAGSGR